MLRSILVLVFGVLMVLAGDVEAQNPVSTVPAFSRIEFDGVSAEMQVACRRVMISTAARFEKITGIAVGYRKIRVRLVPVRVLDVKDPDAVSEVGGVCRVSPEGAEILVATKSSQSIAAILAHEVTHAYLVEAYGSVRNLHLNEGLAQYLAGCIDPSLRSQMWRAFTRGSNEPFAQPYLWGFHFVDEHAEDPSFAGFIKKHIDREGVEYDELEKAWREKRG